MVVNGVAGYVWCVVCVMRGELCSWLCVVSCLCGCVVSCVWCIWWRLVCSVPG